MAGVAVFVGVGVVVLGNVMKNGSGGIGGLLAGLGSNDMAEYTGASEFKNGFVTVNCKNEYFSECVIDEDFKIRYTFSGQDVEMRDGWTVFKEFGGSGQYKVVNPDGEVAYNYEEKDGFKFQLVDGGYAIITEQDDSYNNSEKKTGIYNLAEKKYVVEPSAEYNEAKYGGTNMVFLKKETKREQIEELGSLVSVTKITDQREIYFNLVSHEKIAVIVGDSDNLFIDGYMLSKGDWIDDLFITDAATGEIKNVKLNYSNSVTLDNYANGMFFTGKRGLGSQEKSEIVNLKTGKAIDLGKDFTNLIENKPMFTKEGYALVDFRNPNLKEYYVVINGEGEFQFNPVSMDDGVDLMTSNLSSDGYFVTREGDEYQVRNYRNEIVYRVKGERISGVTNGVAIVGADEVGLAGSSNGVYRTFSGEMVKLERTAETKDL